MMNNITKNKIYFKQSLKEVVLNWRDYLRIFINNFILVPSAMLIFAYLLGYIDELNREIINYYFTITGFLSLGINTLFKCYFPSYPIPYISKAIEIDEGYIYSLRLKSGNYRIEEKRDGISILKDSSVGYQYKGKILKFYELPLTEQKKVNSLKNILNQKNNNIYISKEELEKHNLLYGRDLNYTKSAQK